jgi:chromosome segregation ATPase
LTVKRVPKRLDEFVALPLPPETAGLDELDAAIERATSAAVEELKGLRAALRAAETQGTMYQNAAEQRVALIDDLTQALGETRAVLEQLRAESIPRSAHDALQRVADERAALIELLSTEVEAVRAVANERLSLVDQLTTDVGTVRATAEERLTLIEHLSSQTEALAVEVERLHEEAHERERRIVELQSACDERLALVDQLSAESAMLRAVAEDRSAAIAEISAVAERRAGLLADLTAELESRTRQLQGLRRARS